MKCFIVENLKVTDYIPLFERESKKTGNKFFAVEVGSEGRGRKLSWVACHPRIESDWTEDDMPCLYNAGIGKTKAGNYYIVPPNKPDDNRALVRVYGVEGYRGALEYQISEGITILATGYCAQGAAGRMGGGEEHLVIMEPGSSIDIERFGRLYGSNQRIRIEWDGEELVAFDPAAEPEECDLNSIEDI